MSRAALVVGVGLYQDGELRRLRAPIQDVEALGDVLADPLIGGFDVTRVLDQPRRTIARMVEEFFHGRVPEDVLVLHLSCHGLKDDDGRLYFAATDTERRWPASTGISAAFLNDAMERCRARSIVLLLDCCYSGAFLRNTRGDSEVHLGEYLGGRGRAVLTASNAIEYAWEDGELSGEGQPSLFTGAVVTGLRTGAADRDKDGLVSVEDLYHHVFDAVKAAGRGQTPTLWAMGIERDVYVARNPSRTRVPIAPQLVRAQPKTEDSPVHDQAGAANELSRQLAVISKGLSQRGPLPSEASVLPPLRGHWITLIGSMWWSTVLVVIALAITNIVLSRALTSNGTFVVSDVAVGVYFMQGYWKWLKWRYSILMVTSQRVIVHGEWSSLPSMRYL